MDLVRRGWIWAVVLALLVGAGLSACNKSAETSYEPDDDPSTASQPSQASVSTLPPDEDVAAGPPLQPDDSEQAAAPADELPMSEVGDDDYATAEPPPRAAPARPPPIERDGDGQHAFPPPPHDLSEAELDDVFVTGVRRDEPPRWRTSVRSRSCTDCDVVRQVEERMDYAVTIRLTNDDEEVEGGVVSPAMEGIILDVPEGQARTFKLVPLYVDGLKPLNSVDAKPTDIVVRRPQGRGLWGEATLQLAVLPNAKKCASLIVSVWDASLTLAHDAFLVTMPVGKPGTTSQCRDPVRPGTVLSGPSLVSIMDVFRPPVASATPETHDRISLYAFELPIEKNSYMFAVIDPAQGEPTVSGWKLKRPLSESFGLQATDFNDAAERDRDRMNGADADEWIYERTAKFIKRKLFTAEFTSGGDKPDEVFKKLQAVINRDGANANVMAQIFVPIEGSDESGLMFLPLRTLAAANSKYFKDFRFASPLPGVEEDEEHVVACVSKWNLVLNTSLADSTGERAEDQSDAQAALGRLARLEPKPWRQAALTSDEAIRDFFENQDDAEDQHGSTGIIIAAHYGRSSLGLEDDQIDVDDLTALRARHSVAVLAACETGAPTEANGIIRSLRQQNVDAFLASPLRVPTDYAIRFVESLVKQIDLAYASGEQPTLDELYAKSMDNVETRSEGQRVEARNLGREFVIVGDASRRLCKLSVTEGGGNGTSPNP